RTRTMTCGRSELASAFPRRQAVPYGARGARASMSDRKLRVAVVDDEESIRRALLRLLRAADYDAEAFDSAVGFLRSLGKRTPDCVILDLQMPQMTGMELQQRLLELARRPAVI